MGVGHTSAGNEFQIHNIRFLLRQCCRAGSASMAPLTSSRAGYGFFAAARPRSCALTNGCLTQTIQVHRNDIATLRTRDDPQLSHQA